MAECEQSYQDAMSVTCPPTQMPTAAPGLYEATGSTLTESDLSDPASTWMFNQQNNNAEVQEAFGLNSGNTLAVSSSQYVVVDDTGRVYETCVQHGASGDSCQTDSLYCWNGNNAGSASEQRSALLAAATRNDFKVAACPTLVGVCDQITNFYRNEFPNSPLTVNNVWDNMCVTPTDAVMYVMRDAYKHVCVGLVSSGGANVECPADLSSGFFCAGLNGGLGVYGWPGQIMGALDIAYENATPEGASFDADAFTHPQCRM